MSNRPEAVTERIGNCMNTWCIANRYCEIRNIREYRRLSKSTPYITDLIENKLCGDTEIIAEYNTLGQSSHIFP